MGYVNNLKKLIDKSGTTQKELAQMYKKGDSTISQYISGKRDPGTEFWCDLADRFEVSVDFLVGMTDDPNGTKYGNEVSLDYEKRELISAWEEADEKDKIRVAHDLAEYGFAYEQKKEKEQAG